MRLDLNGKWFFYDTEKKDILEGNVPGCNYLDLIDNNLIPDPFIGTNEKDVYYVAEKDYVYYKDFKVTEKHINYKKIFLNIKQLDTIADIYINDNLVASTSNCHIAYTYDIKQYLKIGINRIKVYLHSPVNYVKSQKDEEQYALNFSVFTGAIHIRKPQCHFGWDWGPDLPPSGISGDIYIEFIDIAKIKDVKIIQEHLKDSVSLCICGDIDNYVNKDIKIQVDLRLNNKKIEQTVLQCQDNFNTTILISNPKLWQTYEWSQLREQPLYDLKVSIIDGDNEVDVHAKKIGLRTIELNRTEDEYGGNFQFILNGQPLFAKGACWIPPDSFINRFTKDKIEEYIKTAIKSNFNMIRVWGGGYYESDDFYDLCDRYGILVWQDFAFACKPYPFFKDDFTKSVLDEVAYNVKRLRHHASLCLWCGNNEIELLSNGWLTKRKFIEWTEKFFYNILPDNLKEYDAITPYIAGTPVGSSHNKNVNSDNYGNTHLWAVWHGLQDMKYYRKRMTRFCSEFGFESLPDIKAIEKYAREEHYSLTSEVFNAHQKCTSGNMKMVYYIASRFRLPKNFTDYIYLSQICQVECVKDATEHWRRNKGRCNGSLFWQYNDCWPVCSWASLDYYGNYKALQYHAQHFFNPLMVSIENSSRKLDIYVINDYLNNVSCEVLVSLIDYDGKVYLKERLNANINKNKSEMIKSYTLSTLKKLCEIKKCVFVADLMVDNKLVNRKTILFDYEKNINLPNVNISVDVTEDNNFIYYHLKSDKYVRLLMLSSIINAPFSDNYMDLLPNETITISQENIDSYSVEDVKNTLKLTNLGIVEPESTRFKDNVIRFNIFKKSINLLNYIYYKFIAKN